MHMVTTNNCKTAILAKRSQIAQSFQNAESGNADAESPTRLTLIVTALAVATFLDPRRATPTKALVRDGGDRRRRPAENDRRNRSFCSPNARWGGET